MTNTGILQKIFRRSPAPRGAERVEVLSGGPATFAPFGGNAYDDDIYRSGIDAIARNAGKLEGLHVIRRGDQNEPVRGDRLNRLLQIQPNPRLSSYDFLYQFVTRLYLYNNSFALLNRDDRGDLQGVYPFLPVHADFIENQGILLLKCFFRDGGEYIFDYRDVVHLRRNFNSNELFGDPNTALFPALELSHVQNEGQKCAIQQGARIRGVLKSSKGMLSEVDRKAQRDEFVHGYLTMANDGGVVVLDASQEYTPLNEKPQIIDAEQTDAIKTRIYNYLGLTEGIVSSKYSEAEWSSFYESVLEPIAIQLGLEFTRKLFSDREQAFGNQIVFDSGRLQFSSNQTKISLIANTAHLPLFTINEYRQILNRAPIEGGDITLQSLNYINSEKADEYQTGDSRPRVRRIGADNEGNTNL